MKRTVIAALLVAILMPGRIFSQVDIEWLPPVKGDKFMWTDVSYMETDQDEMKVVFSAGGAMDPTSVSRVYLATISRSEGKILNKEEIINPKFMNSSDEFKSYSSMGFYKMGPTLVWVYMGNGKKNMYARTISDGSVSNRKQLMAVPDNFECIVRQSPDHKLISLLVYPAKKKAKGATKLLVFNSELNTVYEKEFKLDTDAEEVHLYNLGLSNNGDFFMIVGVDIPKSSRTKGMPTEELFLFSVINHDNHYDGIPEGIKLDMGNKFLSGIIAREDTIDGTLMIAGTYADKKGGNIKGLFVARSNAEWSEVGEMQFNEMDTRISKSLSINVWDKDAVGRLSCKELFSTRDGGFAMHVEVEYKIYRWLKMGPISILAPYYVNGPGGIVKFDIDGKAQWASIFTKYQAAYFTPPPTYNGSMVYYHNNKFYLFMNNHPKNLVKTTGTSATIYYMGTGAFVSAVVNENGDADVRTEKTYKEVGIAPYLRSFVKMSNNEVFFIGYGKKGTGMGTIRLN